jgi:hypothetical protein
LPIDQRDAVENVVRAATGRWSWYEVRDLAGAFSPATSDGELSPACAAVDAFIAENLSLFEAFREYGYSNPTFNPDAVCPF